ncbi:NUDIX hydrolase [Candidatus Woesearchaeota archaeon]|nr:NUDIX hydrolase [Candidatus Woesearchaeota archaeon]
MKFEFWKYKGREVKSRWISSKDYKKFKPITQVYGICFTKDEKVLIVKDLEGWKLPGGTPEKNEPPEETLKREVYEEASVVIGKSKLIGAQEVIMDRKNFYQLRFIAIIDNVENLKPDISTGRLMKRKFIEKEEFNDYIKWGETGKKMFKEAKKAFSSEM